MARRFVSTQLAGWGATEGDPAEDRVADAVLATSELLANAARFCTGDIGLRLVVHRAHIEIAVSDDNPTPAQLRSPDLLTPGGRGLLLVDTLAEEWGQEVGESGKTVWARLALPPGSALARGCAIDD